MAAERVTIAHVAAEAGVSSMTVSNVLNGRPGASDVTRKRVVEVAERLGYQPHLGAKSMRSGRTGLVGAVTLDLVSEYSHEILRGVAEALADEERELLLHASIDSIHELERIQLLAHDLAEGILLVAPQLEQSTLEAIATLDIPVVVIDPRQLDVDLPRVTVDNYDGVRVATEHLLALGHTRIGYIRGEDDLESSEARHRGYADGMKLALGSVDPGLTRTAGFSYESGLRSGGELIDAEAPTAIIAGADLIALGALDAARSRGLKVPEHISIVGFDDIPRAAQSFPPLTTVRQPLHDMGLAGARALVSLIENRPLAANHVRLPTTFVERATTAPPSDS